MRSREPCCRLHSLTTHVKTLGVVRGIATTGGSCIADTEILTMSWALCSLEPILRTLASTGCGTLQSSSARLAAALSPPPSKSAKSKYLQLSLSFQGAPEGAEPKNSNRMRTERNENMTSSSVKECESDSLTNFDNRWTRILSQFVGDIGTNMMRWKGGTYSAVEGPVSRNHQAQLTQTHTPRPGQGAIVKGLLQP